MVWAADRPAFLDGFATGFFCHRRGVLKVSEQTMLCRQPVSRLRRPGA
jgi:hypothetical protein